MNDPCASSSATEQQLSRLEKERARKCAKRARESLVETENKKNEVERGILCIGHLNQRLNVYSILLLISSGRLIIGYLSQRVNVHSVLLLVSSKRLIVEVLRQKLSIYSVLLLVSSKKLIVELQNQKFNKNSIYVATVNVLPHVTVEEREQRRETDRINVTR